MKSADLYEVRDYKKYLAAALEVRSQAQKGQRLKLAKALPCHPSFITQVLNGHLDFTPEQALRTSQFLGHTANEGRLFLNLVLHARAGNAELKNYYGDEIKRLCDEHLMVKNRVESYRTLPLHEQALYYRVWYLAAIHMAVAIPSLQTREAISAALNLPLSLVGEAVELLLNMGLIKQQEGQLKPGEVSLLLGTDSPFLIRHQTNWRMQAIQTLDRPSPENLHYSGVITCSKKDLTQIREVLMQTLQTIRSIVKNSDDEVLATYNLDLFKLMTSEN